MADMVLYTGLVWKPDKEGGDFGVSFPDFPGCVSAGKTMNEAIENAKEALIFHIEGMIEDGEDIPEPTELFDATIKEDGYIKTIDEIRDRPFIPTLINIPKPSKSVRFNIHATSAELMRIDKAAESLGKPRSRFLIESALEKAERL